MAEVEVAAPARGNAAGSVAASDAVLALLKLFAASADRAAYLDGVVAHVSEWTGCACAALRVVTASHEIPYVASVGYACDFTREESWLSLDRDACVCIRAIRGRPLLEDGGLLTPTGSYCTADLQGFGRSLSPEGLVHFRGRCIAAGFKSLAVVPLHHRGLAVGLIHVADTGPGKLTPARLALLETIAPVVAEALERYEADHALVRAREAERTLGALRAISLSPAPVGALLDASLDGLRRASWLPPVLGASVVVTRRATGEVIGAAERGDPGCPAAHACGACPRDTPLGTLEFRFAGRGPEDPLPTEPSPATILVPLGADGPIAGTLRVCVAVIRRDAHLERFLESAAGIVAGGVQRRMAEDALRESERRYREILETTGEGFCALDAEGRATFANGAMARMVGRAPDELVGRPVFELLEPAAADEVRRRLARRREGLAERFEVALRHRDGHTVWAEVAATPAFERGEYRGARALLRDVTERRTLQQRLLASERLSSMGALAAGVAHEVNNPLAYVTANVTRAAEALRRIDVEGARGAERDALLEIAHALNRAAEGADRVRVVVRDLKAFSRADDEKVELVDLEKLLESCAAMAHAEIKHRARLVKRYREVPPVRGCAARLGQVFLNLLVNAAQAIAPGRADLNEVAVATDLADDGTILVAISDTGVGIPPAVRARIFEPFFTTKPIGEGTGLGLSICHGIVSALGGRIEVDSAPGRGSTFRVFLPAANPAEVPAPPAERPVVADRRGRVLIVDDEPCICEALCALLESDHDVDGVTSAAEVLARLDAGERYDVVLCDLMMPQQTGMELHDEVARRWPELAPRFVFLSGGVSSPDARRFLARVRNEAYEKPIDIAVLRRAIAARLDRA